MGMKNIATSVYVRVEGETPLSYGFWQDHTRKDRTGMADYLTYRASAMEDEAKRIATDVFRHVDDVTVCRVEREFSQVCEFCGAEWTEGASEHNGGCCTRDRENVPEDE